MSRINCLASSQGGGADLHGDMRERNMGAACHSSKCVTIIFDLFSLPGTQHFNSSGIHKNNGRNLLEKKKKKNPAHTRSRPPREAQSLILRITSPTRQILPSFKNPI